MGRRTRRRGGDGGNSKVLNYFSGKHDQNKTQIQNKNKKPDRKTKDADP